MAETGAYDLQLSEAYFGLGVAQQQQNDHSEALKTFKKAAQIQRVNSGLYSTESLPILEKMIDSQIALRQWEEVDDGYHVLLSTSGRSFGRGDPRIIPLVNKASRWHMFAYRNWLGENPLSHLHAARALFAYGADLTIKNYGAGDASLAKLLRAQLATEYDMARLALDAHTRQALQEMSNRNLGFSDSVRPIVPNRIAGGSNAHANGLRTINKMLALYKNNEQAPADAHPLALVELGDWYMLFNKRRSGLKAYQQAWSHFAADPALADKAKEVFAMPTRLPTYDDEFSASAELDNSRNLREANVLLSMDVTVNGSVRQVSVLEQQHPAHRDAVNRAVREMRSSRFRPVFVDGLPVEHKDMKFRYFYNYKAPRSARANVQVTPPAANENVSSTPLEQSAKGDTNE